MEDRAVALANRGATGAGVATLVIGAALVIAPEPTGRLLGLDRHLDRARLIGISDLALAPALIFARRRGPWMAVRALLNLLLAQVYRSEIDHRPNARAQGGQAAMYLLTAIDGTSAVVLEREG